MKALRFIRIFAQRGSSFGSNTTHLVPRNKDSSRNRADRLGFLEAVHRGVASRQAVGDRRVGLVLLEDRYRLLVAAQGPQGEAPLQAHRRRAGYPVAQALHLVQRAEHLMAELGHGLVTDVTGEPLDGGDLCGREREWGGIRLW